METKSSHNLFLSVCVSVTLITSSDNTCDLMRLRSKASIVIPQRFVPFDSFEAIKLADNAQSLELKETALTA